MHAIRDKWALPARHDNNHHFVAIFAPIVVFVAKAAALTPTQYCIIFEKLLVVKCMSAPRDKWVLPPEHDNDHHFAAIFAPIVVFVA